MKQRGLAVWGAMIIAATATILSSAAVAGAQVKPGDMITMQNAAKVKDLLSPGVYWKVQHGMVMNIVSTQRIDWPPSIQGRDRKIFLAGSLVG